MKTTRFVYAFLALILIVSLLPARAVQAQSSVQPTPGPLFVPGQVLVTLTGAQPSISSQAQANMLSQQVNGEVVFQYGDIALLNFAPDADVNTLVQQLQGRVGVASAQPNYIYSVPESGLRPLAGAAPTASTYTIKDWQGRSRTFTADQLRGMRSLTKKGSKTLSVPAFPVEYTSDLFKAWGWNVVEADVIWRNTSTSPMVCEIDTGVDYRHPDLLGKVLNGPDFINDDATANDDNGHGTHVAGIITALSNNGANTATGISNGRVLAVKALNAQGVGTSASIAAGLYYCANRTDIRSINLSLGSSQPDPLIYNALLYAIKTKNRLVVAAAGNSSSSALVYPAAWSSSSTLGPGNAANEIYSGLVSVASARANPNYEKVWVDTNGDNLPSADEFFDNYDCADQLSSYGKTVDIVAPGDYIYSTLPVNYPFYFGYYYGYSSKYDYLSGTSMAAAYVSGAAARTLSVQPSLPAYAADPASVMTLKKRLNLTGRTLTYAVDPHANPSAPQASYYQYSSWTDPSTQAVYQIHRAPFCWPTNNNNLLANPSPSNPFGADQDMSQAAYLDVSASMGRFGLYAEATDAYTGLPLVGAKFMVTNYPGKVFDTSVVGRSSAGVFLTNLPMPSTGMTPFYLWVSKAGYTAGFQYYTDVQMDAPDLNDRKSTKGGMLISPYNTLGIPPAVSVTAVLDWDRLSSRDLDLYMWLPSDAHDANGPIQGVIGPGRLLSYLPGYSANLDLGKGTLLSPAQFNPGGVSPFAQFMHDGGTYNLAEDTQPFDSITIKRKPGTTAVLPYYTAADIAGTYAFFVTDYSKNYSGTLKNNTPVLIPGDSNFVYPIVRVWYKGRLMNWAALSIKSNASCNAASHDWWSALTLKGAAITITDTCGTAGLGTAADHGILPYAP